MEHKTMRNFTNRIAAAILALTFGCGPAPDQEGPSQWECTDGLIGQWEFVYWEDFPTNQTCGVKETVAINLSWHPMGVGVDFPDCTEALVTADTHVCDDLGALRAWNCGELPLGAQRFTQFRITQIGPNDATGTQTDQLEWTDPQTLELKSCRSEYTILATKVGG